MAGDVLRSFRETVDAAAGNERAAFARAARNACAQAILAAALAPGAVPPPPAHEPPEQQVRELLGPELGEALSTVYRGDADWTSRAIDLLEPLNALARAG